MQQEQTEQKTPFKIRYVLIAILLLLFILSLGSHNPADLAVLEGGSSEPIRNLIGPLGAKIARVLFYLFGLAVYPITLFLLICLVRSFIPVPTRRKGYIGALAAVIIGITLLMAMWPQETLAWTEHLGIGHADAPELALSGGVLGAQFAAPACEDYSDLTHDLKDVRIVADLTVGISSISVKNKIWTRLSKACLAAHNLSM